MKRKPGTDTYTRDKRQIINWATGVVGAALIAGVGWAGTHVLAAESVSSQHELRIKSLEERADEDRALSRGQFNQISEKLDRIMERVAK